MKDDVIYRQQAIDAVKNYWKSEVDALHTNPKYADFNEHTEACDSILTHNANICKALDKLPPAQPEPCDDPRADVYYLAEKIGIHRLYALVVELRGEPEPCEDAVSREAVSEWLKQYGQDVLHGKYKFSLMYIWKNLMGLPSAQPQRKKGKWITVQGRLGNEVECNQCHSVFWYWMANYRFCAHCGADMRGESDE